MLPVRGTSGWSTSPDLVTAEGTSQASAIRREEGAWPLDSVCAQLSPNRFLSKEERELLGSVHMHLICFSTSGLCSLAGKLGILLLQA